MDFWRRSSGVSILEHRMEETRWPKKIWTWAPVERREDVRLEHRKSKLRKPCGQGIWKKEIGGTEICGNREAKTATVVIHSH
ncbi:hypothetical protein HHI36_004664, partial [Cryptolaemus montrouzieri]